jgi:uncharacterized SAM-binding protein YcdF (DUF218 family)
MARFLKVLLTISILAVGIPGLIWACGFIVFTGVISAMIEPENPEATDAIIVLTGGTNRVSRGLDLLAEGKAKELMISGVHKDVKQAELLKIWGYKKPLNDCCITLGHEAGNTIGNAIEARKWVDETSSKSIRLITATYHMPRALLEFRHALPNVTIIPHPVIPENFQPRSAEFWKLSFLEYHKLLMSTVRVFFFPLETTPVPQALQ